ncbi:MAG: hypothetical protein WDA24_02180 [Tissierellales bacterium]
MGLLSGTDDKGTFAPKVTAKRGEAAAVVRRMIEPSARASVYFSTPAPVIDQTQGAITITEYQKSERRLAKAGDIVVKADGTFNYQLSKDNNCYGLKTTKNGWV